MPKIFSLRRASATTALIGVLVTAASVGCRPKAKFGGHAQGPNQDLNQPPDPGNIRGNDANLNQPPDPGHIRDPNGLTPVQDPNALPK